MMSRRPDRSAQHRGGRGPQGRRGRALHRQRGVVLIFSLIVLLILTIGAIALMRSMNSSLFTAGNLSFRRDLVNQGEQAASAALSTLLTGALMDPTLAQSDLPSANYKASILPANQLGIPTALLDNTAFAAVGVASNDLTGATSDVTIRYVIDRLCNIAGPPTGAICVQSSAAPTGGTAGAIAAIKPPTATVYRLSARISGPRGTQVFLQTTLTKPD